MKRILCYVSRTKPPPDISFVLMSSGVVAADEAVAAEAAVVAEAAAVAA